MNIYNYINSPDIAEYCKKIGHTFNPLEMAVIISASDKTTKEKHTAWHEIIEHCPDMPIQNPNLAARESLHGFLRELISWEEKCIADFYMLSGKVVYQPVIEWGDKTDNMGCYSTVKKAIEAAKKRINGKWDWEKVSCASICKEYIDEDERNYIEINPDGEILSVRYGCGESCPGDLDAVFVHIPLPFERGDIITMGGGEPGVLDSIPHWWTHQSYDKFVSGEGGDGYDMIVYYYYISENGELTRNHFYPLYNLQFYKDELKGQNRFLKYLSKHIKTTSVYSFDWLIAAYNRFKTEAETKVAGSFFEHGSSWNIDTE